MNPHHTPQPASPTSSHGSNRSTIPSLGRSWRSLKTLSLALAFPALLPMVGHAAELTTSDVATGGYFGHEVNTTGNNGLVGASVALSGRGAAYLYRSLDTAAGTVTENAKLTASDAVATDYFGRSVSLSGSVGLIGAYNKITTGFRTGKAYVFRNLDTATGTITQNAELLPSVSAYALFGNSVSLSGTTGLIGAPGENTSSGSAYLFRGLDSATGTITENAKLTASAPEGFASFGGKVSLAGNMGLIGAAGTGSARGAAYVFRNLDTATGPVTQDAYLHASDYGQPSWNTQLNFGDSVSLSGTTGLVGAGTANRAGAAYLFRGLDTASGVMTEHAKLVASDLPEYSDDYFGVSASLSGTNALISAFRDDQFGADSGSAYLFRDLDTATGSVTEIVKINASDAAASDGFGFSVSLDGDNFLVGAHQKNSYTGKTYSGSFSSLTTLDTGNVDKLISGIDFVSRTDWIIGQTTDANTVALESGSRANVTASGKKIYIGKDAGSDNNTLFINGNLTATEVRVGATGNTGNALILEPDGLIPTGAEVIVASGSSLGGSGTLEGNLTLSPGGKLEFDATAGLVVQGSITLDSTFGVDDILGLDGSIAPNTYNLITGSTTNFTTLGLQNFGSENAYHIGGTNAAYLDSPFPGNLALTVYTIPLPVVTSAATASGKVGTVLTYQITATNSPTTFSALSLPAGLSVNTSTGKISGLPTTPGTFNTSVRATNAGGTGIKAVTFTILPLPPVITSATTASGKIGTALSYQITASNTPTSFSALSLPTGLSFNTTSGIITGVPTTAGTFTATVRATNAGGTGTKTITFTIAKETTKPILSITKPSSLRVATTKASFTVEGKATDNISPTKVEYRIKPPGSSSYGPFKSMALAGTAKSKTWSYRLEKITKGAWKVEFRARDAAGNISTSTVITITNK